MFIRKKVVIKPKKALALIRGHPWVLSSSVSLVDEAVADGEVVDVVSEQGQFIARGIYNSKSHICVRLYTQSADEELDWNFWRTRLQRAIALRHQLGLLEPQGACRLVFSEADGLSGLVVDRYGPYLVVQITAQAMAVRTEELIPLLIELVNPQGILVRWDPAAATAEGVAATAGRTWGEVPEQVTIREHGTWFRVDLVAGQKTGFYLDQRDNRRAAAEYLAGADMLDMYCYTGGFALVAARVGQAKSVLAFDSSSRAIQLAKANAELNGLTNAQFEVGEAFEVLENFVRQGRRFDAVVLDPPRFAGHRRKIDQALRAYHWLNRLAVQVLHPGGILVTCSCSGRVSRQQFLDMLAGVAEKTRRSFQILEQRGAAADHPVLLACPETEYLKCVICRVL